MWYVTMTDKFMSGWGLAEGKIDKLVIACDTLKQAREIEEVAHKRNEMKYINIRGSKPYYNSHKYFVSNMTYEQMTGWRN